jgi:hypothetical protein
MSYSLYLWHWPLIVFTKMGFLPFIPRMFWPYALSILALSLAAGALSWRLIEQPFRVGRLRKMSRPKLLGVTGLAMACSAAVALALLSLNGLKSRFPANAIKVADMMDAQPQTRVGTCFITTKYRFEQFRPDLCMKIDPAKKNYLLLGDSHSAALWYGLTKLLPAVNILQASVSGCNPILNAPEGRNCGQMMRYVFRDFLPSHPVNAIFLTARWRDETDFDKDSDTVDWCTRHQIPVHVLGAVVEYDTPLPRLLAYSIAFNDSGLPERHMLKRFQELDAAMKQRSEGGWKVHYASIVDAECPRGECSRYADTASSVPLMGDDNHLSNAGSVFVVQRLILAGELPL